MTVPKKPFPLAKIPSAPQAPEPPADPPPPSWPVLLNDEELYRQAVARAFRRQRPEEPEDEHTSWVWG